MKNLPRDTHPAGLHYHDLEDNMFRIVQIQPAKPDDILDVEINLMSFYSLEDEGCKHYVPVSYRWKPSQERVPARISGEIEMIPRDLDRLMRKARWPEGSEIVRTMWIDQLCINQDDDNDKAQQVPLIRSIFERAASTIVWLGDEGVEDCALAFDLVKRWYELTSGLDDAEIESMSFEELLGPPTEDNLRSFRALRALMKLDYWDRTWVLQEATADRVTPVWYGDVQEEGFPLGWIFHARNLIMGLNAMHAPPVYGLEDTPSAKVGRLENFRILRRNSTPHPLLKYLSLVRRTQCSDHRDKVFSVLPFAADVGDYLNNRFLKPDYQRSAFEVYVDVARWHICTKQNLDILGYCSLRMDTDPFFLPSWVPNWTTSTFLEPLPKVLDHTVPTDEQQPMYKACGRFSHTSQLVYPPLEGWSTNQLFLSGLYIGTVHRVLEPVTALFLALDMERSWEDRLDTLAPYSLTGESMLTAFRRTIMVDREPIDNQRKNRDKFRRGASLTDWPDPSNALEYMDRAGFIKQMTRHRKLFFVDSRPIASKIQLNPTATAADSHPQAADSHNLIMCLGREDVRVGDQLWALKGGSVLYVLHSRGQIVKMNDAKTQGDEPHNANLPDQLWFNGAKRDWDAEQYCRTYHFVGEAYAHGLMDGEALEYAEGERPEVLKDMAGEFEEILLGMGAMSLEDEEKTFDEDGRSMFTYRVEEGLDCVREVPEGKKLVWKLF